MFTVLNKEKINLMRTELTIPGFADEREIIDAFGYNRYKLGVCYRPGTLHSLNV